MLEADETEFKKPQRETILFTLHRSRKSFLPEYFCGLFLLGLLGYAYFTGYQLGQRAALFCLALAAIAIAYAEISRLIIKYEITNTKVMITTGIFNRHKKNVNFHPLGFVPDLNLRQTYPQRLLNYGTIYIQGGNENQLEIVDVDNPHGLLEILENLIDRNRRKLEKV